MSRRLRFVFLFLGFDVLFPGIDLFSRPWVRSPPRVSDSVARGFDLLFLSQHNTIVTIARSIVVAIAAAAAAVCNNNRTNMGLCSHYLLFIVQYATKQH